MFDGPFGESIIKIAKEKSLVDIYVHDLRKWTTDKRKTVDDKPYGGGPGMIMKVEPFFKAVKEIRANLGDKKTIVILTSAKGEVFNQSTAEKYSKVDALIVLCGHYEGVDERVAQYVADNEVSIGEYVLTGGELPAMVITDAIVRLISGVLGNKDSLKEESFGDQVKSEHPQYTRPETFIGDDGEKWKVPEILLSGDHIRIQEWQKKHQNLTNMT